MSDGVREGSRDVHDGTKETSDTSEDARRREEVVSHGAPAFDAAWSVVERSTMSRGRFAHDIEGTWRKAWHGCKLEALYALVCRGGLRASVDAEGGDRFFVGALGAYVFADSRKKKARGAMRGAPPWKIWGAFCSVCWEVWVGRGAPRILKTGTDQWIQPEEGVRLAALWLRGGAHPTMVNGTEVQGRWSPSTRSVRSPRRPDEMQVKEFLRGSPATRMRSCRRGRTRCIRARSWTRRGSA